MSDMLNSETLTPLICDLKPGGKYVAKDLFEAGGIPLVRALRESLRGEPVTRVMGIVNGTTNFILTKKIGRASCRERV